MKTSALFAIDFYKADHRRQYPKDTQYVYSNLTPRYSRHANVPDKSGIIFFGLQYFMKDFLIDTFNETFFKRPKEEVLAEYQSLMDTALGEGAIPIEHIGALHDLQFLPVKIRALREGSFAPIGVPVLTIENTLPEFFWLTNYLETILSTYLWLPCTSATTAFNLRKLLETHRVATGSPDWFIDFQAHDFSFRGMSSLQSALTSGAGHLLSFKGTDTVPAIQFLQQYYGGQGLIGTSVPATEHSVMCMGGQDDEIGTFRRLITELYPKGIVSIVSDTWDFWKVMTDYAVQLREEIMQRDGKVVFRPDSGNPLHILCGTAYPVSDKDMDDNGVPEHYSDSTDAAITGEFEYLTHNGRYWPIKGYLSYGDEVQEIGDEVFDITPEMKGAVEILWDTFGGTTTETGHKLLDQHVGLIYGDSIDYYLADDILKTLALKGFASANVVFGVGSYTYQYATRDTWGFAVKATAGIVADVFRAIFKKPKTDNGGKNSARGLVRVIDDGYGKLMLQDGCSPESLEHPVNKLQVVFENSQIVAETTLQEIRETILQSS